MTRSVAPCLLAPLDGLAENPRAPAYLRLADRLRKLIRHRTLASDSRLPASRVLAHALSLSRSTVEQAYGVLEQEGWICRRRGSGSFVATQHPVATLDPPSDGRFFPVWSGSPLTPSSVGDVGFLPPIGRHSGALLALGPPDAALFPRAVWTKLIQRAVARPGSELWSSHEPQGYGPLRSAIARHVAGVRGVACTPQDVVVVTGTQQALALIAQAVLRPGDAVLFEEPGYGRAAAAFELAGATLKPVPVDDQGPDLGRVEIQGARAFYTTPSHQFPTGITTSLRRRGDNLAKTLARGIWTIEDDYDHELMFDRPPVVSIQGLSAGPGVIHIGTFNKAMFASLCLGYMIVPADAREAIVSRLRAGSSGQSLLVQAAMADFLGEGHFETYMRTMREVYRERRAAFFEASGALAPHLEFSAAGGMYVTGFAKWPFDDVALSARAADLGIGLQALSPHYRHHTRRGFVFGVASGDPRQIATAVRRVGALLTEAKQAAAQTAGGDGGETRWPAAVAPTTVAPARDPTGSWRDRS